MPIAKTHWTGALRTRAGQAVRAAAEFPSALLVAAGFAGDVDSEVDLAFIGIGNRGNRAACEFARRDRFNAAALADVETGSPRTLGTLKFFSGAARFQGVGPTYWHGEDLDESTYLRRGIALDF